MNHLKIAIVDLSSRGQIFLSYSPRSSHYMSIRTTGGFRSLNSQNLTVCGSFYIFLDSVQLVCTEAKAHKKPFQ